MEELAQVYAHALFEVADEHGVIDEVRDELQSIRWLGFALCEAVAFYTFIFGLIAFFL